MIASLCRCGKLVKARGMCSNCYEKWRKRHHPKKKDRHCKSEFCRSATHAKGYCRICYRQIRRNGRARQTNYGQMECTIPGCDKNHRAKGLCFSHYNKVVHLTSQGYTWLEAHENIASEVNGGNGRLKLIQERYKILQDKKKRREKRLENYARSLSRDSDTWYHEDGDPVMADPSAMEDEFEFARQDRFA